VPISGVTALQAVRDHEITLSSAATPASLSLMALSPDAPVGFS
jgi:hypothetical protein